MRLISVAKYLKELTVPKSFVLLEDDKGAIDFIAQSGYLVELHLSKESIYQQAQHGDIFVLDGYSFGEDVLWSLNTRGAKIIYIDDLQHLNLSVVDIVIKHTPGYKRCDYRLSEKTTAVFLSQNEVQDIDTLSDWELAELKYKILFGNKS